MTDESSTISQVDRGILRALQLAPRAPYSLIADVLDVSEQTVARRYRYLRDHGIVHVSGVVRTEALGQTHWIVRIRCKPRSAEALALALAQRSDVGWVNILGGAVGVVCSLRARSDEDREDLLIDRLPRSASVLDISAAMTLHTFAAARPDDKVGHSLTPDQERTLLTSTDPEGLQAEAPREAWPDPDQTPAELDRTDWLLLEELARDGRASYAALGDLTATSAGQARRRVQRLVERGVLLVDVDVASAVSRALGAHLWITATPGAVPACGEGLAALPHTSYVAAITGRENLVAAVTCSGTAELYRVVTDGVGQIAGITNVEITPHLRSVKQAGPVTALDLP